MDETKAATSYTNAKEFYESMSKQGKQHIEVVNGKIYYATSAKLASSSSNLKYTTVGYDITFMGNGQSMTISVKREGSLTELKNARVDAGGYFIPKRKSLPYLSKANATPNACQSQ